MRVGFAAKPFKINKKILKWFQDLKKGPKKNTKEVVSTISLSFNFFIKKKVFIVKIILTSNII